MENSTLTAADMVTILARPRSGRRFHQAVLALKAERFRFKGSDVRWFLTCPLGRMPDCAYLESQGVELLEQRYKGETAVWNADRGVWVRPQPAA